ncbi:hypothetical protein [Bacteroides uniformis]|uniref:hypothetical protein n=1 Tax=Bacteroides uniformis TaxID=820 RepID=UPI00129C539D|nr:hypothetical protein [Bacteroides uniformis]
MANKYDKDVFEEYFHINPELSRTGTDMFRAEKQAAGLAGKTDRLYRHRIYTHRVQIQV